MTAVEELAAEHYGRVILEKTRDALARLLAEARRLSRFAPYEYRVSADGRALLPDAKEQVGLSRPSHARSPPCANVVSMEHVVFSGSSFCSQKTFKRLLVIADQIAFVDRPSVSFGGWGTIGQASPARRLVDAFQRTPVQLTVFQTPSGPAPLLYLPYIEADAGAAEFRRTVFEG